METLQWQSTRYIVVEGGSDGVGILQSHRIVIYSDISLDHVDCDVAT